MEKNKAKLKRLCEAISKAPLKPVTDEPDRYYNVMNGSMCSMIKNAM